MSREKGLSLIDLLIAIAISALLLGLGVPNFQQFALKQSADADARQILRHLQKTRELAVLSGKEMIFCGVDADLKCERDNITRLVVFFDENDNRKIDIGEAIETELQLDFPGHIYLRASGAHYIRYFNDGTANPVGSIFLCPSKSDATLIRRVSTNMSGRPYLARPQANGIVANAGGSPINCDG